MRAAKPAREGTQRSCAADLSTRAEAQPSKSVDRAAHRRRRLFTGAFPVKLPHQTICEHYENRADWRLDN